MRLGLGANGPVGFLRRTVPWPLLGVVEGCREAGLTPGGGALIVSAEWAESLVVLWQRRYVCIECRRDGGIESRRSRQQVRLSEGREDGARNVSRGMQSTATSRDCESALCCLPPPCAGHRPCLSATLGINFPTFWSLLVHE